MFRLWIAIICWLIGCCGIMGGCRAQLTAEKLEASFSIDHPTQAAPATVEVHYDADRGGPGESDGPEGVE